MICFCQNKQTEIHVLILTRKCCGIGIFLLLFLLDLSCPAPELELSILEARSSHICRCSLSRASIASLSRTFSATTFWSKTTYWSSMSQIKIDHQSGHGASGFQLAKRREAHEINANKSLLSLRRIAEKVYRQMFPPWTKCCDWLNWIIKDSDNAPRWQLVTPRSRDLSTRSPGDQAFVTLSAAKCLPA